MRGLGFGIGIPALDGVSYSVVNEMSTSSRMLGPILISTAVLIHILGAILRLTALSRTRICIPVDARQNPRFAPTGVCRGLAVFGDNALLASIATPDLLNVSIVPPI